jgi:hypothetical protein
MTLLTLKILYASHAFIVGLFIPLCIAYCILFYKKNKFGIKSTLQLILRLFLIFIIFFIIAAIFVLPIVYYQPTLPNVDKAVWRGWPGIIGFFLGLLALSIGIIRGLRSRNVPSNNR